MGSEALLLTNSELTNLTAEKLLLKVPGRDCPSGNSKELTATLALTRLPRLHRIRQAYAFMLRYFTNILSTVISGKWKSSKDIEKVTEKGHMIKKEKKRFLKVRGQERGRDTRALHVPTKSSVLIRGEKNDCRSEAGKEVGSHPPGVSREGRWVWAV